MKSIILRAHEVRAALDTGVVEIVRVVKPAPKFEEKPTLCEDGIWRGRYRYWCGNPDDPDVAVDVDEMGPCPYGQPRERRWVREAWAKDEDEQSVCMWGGQGDCQVLYQATPPPFAPESQGFSTWRSPVTMPRWASRLTLEITDVRVIRVQDLTNEDALRAGVRIPDCGNSEFDGLGDWEPRDGFADMWDSRAKAGERWEDNPWVWSVTARRVQE